MKDVFDRCVSHCHESCRSTIIPFALGRLPKTQSLSLVPYSGHLSEVSFSLRETIGMTKVTIFPSLMSLLSEQEKAPVIEKYSTGCGDVSKWQKADQGPTYSLTSSLQY